MASDFDASWGRVRAKVELITRESMIGSATNAQRLVPAQLEQAGHQVRPSAQVVPESFARTTMLGADVGQALDSSVIRSKQAISQGAAVDEALDRGEEWLDSLIRSVMADVDRAAQQVQITATPRMGWVRIAPAPCCPRCAILAGRWYRHSSGFQRHPQCDCIHRPAPEDLSGTQDVATADDLISSGGVKGLTGAERQALDDGASLQQIANTRQRGGAGMSVITGDPRRRQIADRTLRGQRVLTPAGIYHVSASREEALRRLIANGYIR